MPKILLVIKPFLPNRRITLRQNMNGGDMIGSNAICLKNGWHLILALLSPKANMNPSAVEVVATIAPSLNEFVKDRANHLWPKMYLYVSMLSLPLGAMLSHNTFHIGHSTKTKISNKTTTRVVRSIGSRVSDFRSAMLSRARDVLGLGLFLTVSVAV
jgi:hypothetical protein